MSYSLKFNWLVPVIIIWRTKRYEKTKMHCFWGRDLWQNPLFENFSYICCCKSKLSSSIFWCCLHKILFCGLNLHLNSIANYTILQTQPVGIGECEHSWWYFGEKLLMSCPRAVLPVTNLAESLQQHLMLHEQKWDHKKHLSSFSD